MAHFTITLLPHDIKIHAVPGSNLLSVLRQAGCMPDAPCGGHGTCGKCKVLADGKEILACSVSVKKDMDVLVPTVGPLQVLIHGTAKSVQPDGTHQYVLAVDIGTTTVAVYLLDGMDGTLLSHASAANPQGEFGADVISRIQYVIRTNSGALQRKIHATLAQLTLEAAEKAGIQPEMITLAAIVGNTAMHHLFLGIDPHPLTVPPYMPTVRDAMCLPSKDILPIHPEGVLRVLPNIAGFVGADTVGCLVATRFHRVKNLTLLIDIGTNGEMVLGSSHRRVACSAAAGPAFEGAKISCGMRAAAGAIDRVTLENGIPVYHTIGDITPIGLCGSGLLDLVAILLDTGIIDASGRMAQRSYTLPGTQVTLTQKDVREVQLAKSAIRTGIELLAKAMGTATEDIQAVFLAGAFGSYIRCASACRIGMIPPVLHARIVPVGNAAGAGAQLCALREETFRLSSSLAENTDFLELASLPDFQDCFIDNLSF